MIDFMRMSSSEVDRFIHMQRTIERQDADATRLRALREYYSGIHPVLLTQRQMEFLGALVHGDAFPFSHNLVRSIVDTLSERLSVEGFAVNGVSTNGGDADPPDANATEAARLWGWWKANRCDLKEQDLYQWALVDGASFVMIDYDASAGRPRIVLHRADDGAAGIRVQRVDDDPDRILFATRYFWEVDPLRPTVRRERKTVYLAHEIRKYARGGNGFGSWQPVSDADDGVWPLPWVDAAGRPLGVPVIEFANPGGSEIEQAIGLQNALNKSWLDLVAAADASGFPLVVAEYDGTIPLGAGESDADIEGADELRLAPGRVLEISGGTLRRLESSSLAPMLDVIWALVAAIAGVSRTPQYYLRPVGGADVPSGEALKQLESGLVARALKRQRVFGQGWEDVMQMARRVENAFGVGAPFDPLATLEVQWADPETRNELATAQTAEAHKRLNVPDTQVWSLLGYTPDQVADFEERARTDEGARIAQAVSALRLQGGGGNGG